MVFDDGAAGPGAPAGLYDEGYFSELIRVGAVEVPRHRRHLTLIEAFRRPGRLLEVGVGVGTFVRLARAHGWVVEGVDVSPFAAAYVRDTLGVPVFCGELTQAKLPAASYDAVNLRHVVEHVPDPVGFLAEVARLLKPTGIVCLSVPNFGSLQARLWGAEWHGLALPYHRIHLTRRTLRRLLETAGFGLLRLRTGEHTGQSWVLRGFNLLQRLRGRPPVPVGINPYGVDPRKGLFPWLVLRMEARCLEGLAVLGWGEELLAAAGPRRAQ